MLGSHNPPGSRGQHQGVVCLAGGNQEDSGPGQLLCAVGEAEAATPHLHGRAGFRQAQCGAGHIKSVNIVEAKVLLFISRNCDKKK